MLKIMGAFMVISCCSLIGTGFAAALKTRAKVLRGLLSALAVMKSEICDFLTPLPELLVMLADRSEGAVREFFIEVLKNKKTEHSFSESWRLAVTGASDMRLAPEDMLALCDLGASLGRYDAEEQKTAISRAEKVLEASLKTAEDERRGKGKVCAAMGLSAGLMIAIIML